MSKRHHVRAHHWIDGVLSTIEHFFESKEDAVKFIDNSNAHTVKVYSPEGELLVVKTPTAMDSYA
jgi:hypothetical protein